MTRLRWHRTALWACLAAAASGCVNLAPEHRRPDSPVAPAWPASAPAPTGGVATPLPWTDFIADARLRQVVALSLQRNRDLRIAVLNIERARGLYRIERSAEAPTVNASAGGTRQRSATTGATTTLYTAAVAVNYEVDFFGRVRNLGDSALQSFFAVEENRRSAQISLVSEVSTAWLTLAADQQRLQLSKDTLTSQQSSHDLTRRAHELGGVSGLTLARSQTTVESARVDVARYTSQVAQDRNALELLAGGPVPDDLLPAASAPLADAAVLVAVPEGLPSDVLQRRPDVIAAEHELRAANADIGVARAAFFPSISLTASAGTQSRSLSGLFGSGTGIWSFSPQIDLPIFDLGRRQAALDVSQAQRDIGVATYERTVQIAFREVADALAQRATLAEQQAAQQALTEATERSLSLSQSLYRSGASSFLDVLDAQRSLYSARQAAITLRLQEQTNRLALYRALGGG